MIDVTIGDLPKADSINDEDLIEVESQQGSMKVTVGQIKEESRAANEKTLRAEEDIQPLPTVGERANKIMAFDDQGNPIAVEDNDSGVSEAVVDQKVSQGISGHNNNDSAHPELREYTDQSISSHNSDGDAHPDLREGVGNIDWLRAGSMSDLLGSLPQSPDDACILRKVSDSRFEVFTPFVQIGRYLRWRFDNDENQFRGAAPLDTAQGYTRPFLQTTVHDVYLESTEDIISEDASSSTPSTISNNYHYVVGEGEYFEFTGVRASRLRCTYLTASNAGIFGVTINGSSILANLLPKDDQGRAYIDAYSAGGGGLSSMIAENLPDEDLTIRFTVIGKNPDATSDRLYLSNSPTFGALRLFNRFTGVGTPVEAVGEILKMGDSAVDYAYSFRPSDDESAPAPFIGSVHGYENRTELGVYVDNGTVDLLSQPDGSFIVARNSVTISQATEMYHPNRLDVKAADVGIVWNLSKSGAKQGHKLKWSYSPFVTNGYTQMWTVYGANQGGPSGPEQGWANRVALRGYESYKLETGDAGEYGNNITDEVLFFGSPTHGNRNAESGRTSCLVRITDPVRSFCRFELSPVAKQDGVWIQDRATFRKMYLQPLRGAGTLPIESTLSGSMSVCFYKTPGMYELLSSFHPAD